MVSTLDHSYHYAHSTCTALCSFAQRTPSLYPPFHADDNTLSRTLTEIFKVAQLINENKREEENKRKVRSIAELFGNKCENLLQPQEEIRLLGIGKGGC